MKKEKLNYKDCTLYPNAKIISYIGLEPNEYNNIFNLIYSIAEFDGANIQKTTFEDIEEHYLSQCKLSLRKESSLNKDEKKTLKKLKGYIHEDDCGHASGYYHTKESIDWCRENNIDVDNFLKKDKAIEMIEE